MTYAEILMRKGKRGAAAYVQAECNSAAQEPSRSPQHLNALLDVLLHPEKNIDDQDTIDWCRVLIGGGRSYEEFAANIRSYDNTAMCGLVWTADFVAFRCRTCGISQCMSLCADCFKDGNHEGHDFNMFKSQAGGACDCGDSSVMRESGFCSQHHGPNMTHRATSVPSELTCVAENMIPRIILRFLQHLRINTVPASDRISATQTLEKYEEVISNADRFLKLLHDFCSLGAAMRSVMTKCLVDKESYRRLTYVNEESENGSFMRRSKKLYEDALESLPNPQLPREFQDCISLTSQLRHLTFMEELVFWTVKYEFPEKLVCLLLKMLPDSEYKEAFTRSFVTHYSRVSVMLVRSSNSDKLSNRIVHVSVQLFSNEELAFQMTEQLSLLHIMVCSLKNMMHDVLISCELHDPSIRKHKVVDCSKHVMSDHCYWPLVSDLNNVLSHPPIAFRFMADNVLLAMWFDFLKMFQGMNLNVRVKGQHVDFEEKTYYASFSGELEASASPMWALVSHLKDSNTREYTVNVLKHCLTAIREWMEDVQFDSQDKTHPDKASFHIPLHRYFSIFLRQAIKHQGFTLKELLPEQDMLKLLAAHPLRVQTAFYEIMCGLWVRNGLQIKGQAMTYIQCHFCKSMVDADLFLLQVLTTQLPANEFLHNILERFQIMDWLSLSPGPRPNARAYRDQEQELQMIESCLIFIVSLLSLRTNLGLDEEALSRLEMVSLLCMADKTHSVLHEHMPEKPGTPVQLELFDRVLSDIATYSEPRFEASGNMQQGMYLPKPFVWEQLYDPIYVLLRAVHRREFQTSIERFNNFAKARFENDSERLKTVMSPWPPWRLPSSCDPGFEDPRRMLQSRYAHGLIFNILHKAVHGPVVNDFITSLAVHLLELALTFPQTEYSGKEVAVSKPWLMIHEPVDLKFDSWFPTDWLSANLRHTVTAIFSHPSSVASTVAQGGTLEGQRRTRGRSRPAAQSETALTAVPQSMEIDQLSDDDANSEGYQVETPTSVVIGGIAGGGADHQFAIAMEDNPSQQTELSDGRDSTVPSSTVVGNQTPSTSQAGLPSAEAITLVVGAGNEIVAATRRNRARAPLRDESSELSPDGISALSSSFDSSKKNAVINVNESIISLMLKLHSKYSGRRDSYVPIFQRKGFSVEKEYRESRVGDACFFIEKVLDLICEFDSLSAQFVLDCRKKLWPDYHEMEAKIDEKRERLEAEEKKRRAKERQRLLMEQMALQRQRFMEGNAMDSEHTDDVTETATPSATTTTASAATEETSTSSSTGDGSGASVGGATSSQTEYTCCNCLMHAPASEDRPIGLVTFIQSTSVLAHKQESTRHLLLPTSDDEAVLTASAADEPLGQQLEDLFYEKTKHFDPTSSLLSTHRGWKGGVHIQSCGHHIHYDCRLSYCETLKQNNRITRDQSLDTDRGEFTCPVCRQMANALLPVPPDAQDLPPGIYRNSLETIAARVQQLMGEETFHMASGATRLRGEMSRIMEFFTKVTLPQYRIEGHISPNHVVTMFISSIARTNLEIDIVQRGGSLVVETRGASALPSFSTQTANTNKPKFCFVPLMHVLAIHMKVMAPRQQLTDEWAALTGLWLKGRDMGKVMLKDNKVPNLLQDPLALMLNFILLLPVNVDLAFFNAIIQACYNLQLAQIFVRSCVKMSSSERNRIKLSAASTTSPSSASLAEYLSKVIVRLEGTGIFSENESFEMDEDGSSDLSRIDSECCRLILPFLRVASLVRHYVFQQDLPEITEEASEFTKLARFLELIHVDRKTSRDDNDMDDSTMSTPLSTMRHEESSISGLHWFTGDASEFLLWLESLRAAVCPSNLTLVRKALRISLIWKQPKLLRLPKNYDQIFQYYHKRKCSNCQRVPKDPTVCLMCGTMVCLKEQCCRQTVGLSVGPCEAVKHSWDCGGGTGIFLSVNSSTIVVIRGKRACFWGSIYLDVFGEEDRELKRGKPLFLHPERYQLLEHQWLTHRFDHTSRKWVWHRDAI